jgi:anti-sigma-K factor RskA
VTTTEPHEPSRDGLAAEYVLGTLEAAEKAEAEGLLKADKGFAAEVEAWRRRLDPLLVADPAPPPAAALDGIFAAIDAEAGELQSEMFDLRRRLGFWRRTAAAAAGLAACLLGALVLIGLREPPRPQVYIAVLETADRKAAFVASAGLAREGLSIRNIGAPPAPGRSFELWAIRPGTPPQSLGVVVRAAAVPAKTLAAKTGGEPLQEILLAITEEPEGGSRDGKPGGAPLYSGKFFEAPSL